MIPFSKELGFSELFRDFLYQPKKVASFYPGQELTGKIDQLSRSENERAKIVEILSRQNRRWNAPAEVLNNI